MPKLITKAIEILKIIPELLKTLKEKIVKTKDSNAKVSLNES